MGAATEIVTVQHQRANQPRQERISTKVRIAVDAMVMDCLTRKEAALKAGLTDHALYCALAKPHVSAYRNTVLGVLRTSEASRTIARGVKLADEAESEHVRNDANKWLAGLEGISPIARSESVNVHKVITPGLTIMIGGWAPHEIAPAEQQAIDITPSVNRIGAPQPHPSRIAAQPTTSGVEPVSAQPGTHDIE